jgi:putative transcriptional regulator
MEPGTSHIRLATGTLLVAAPILEDPNFRRTVILLCEHGEQGSFGLVLNRPLTLRPGEVFDTLSSVPHAIAYGGPVQPETMHFLHRLGDRLPDSIGVVDDVRWGGDFERLQALLESNPALAGRTRFFMGYAGWGGGQLEEEVAEGAWFMAPGSLGEVFASEPETLWRRVLVRLGGRFALLVNYPDDPRLN